MHGLGMPGKPKKPKGKRRTVRLTDKQRRFVEEYVGASRFNGSEAARKAGYSPRTARVIAQDNLANPAIRRAIDKHRAELTEKAKLEAWEVYTAVRRLLTFDHRRLFSTGWTVADPDDLDDDTALALNKVKITETITDNEYGEPTARRTVEVSVSDRLRAAELAARMGGFLDPRGGDLQGIGAVEQLADEFQRWRDAGGDDSD